MVKNHRNGRLAVFDKRRYKSSGFLYHNYLTPASPAKNMGGRFGLWDSPQAALAGWDERG
jgi:hypothetical protein